MERALAAEQCRPEANAAMVLAEQRKRKVPAAVCPSLAASAAKQSPSAAERGEEASEADAARETTRHIFEAVKRRRTKTPSASGGGIGKPSANSACVIASLLHDAKGPPSFPSAGHDGHVDNHGNDDVDSRHGHDHDHEEHDDLDHGEHDGHDHHDVQSPSDEVWERVLGEPVKSFARSFCTRAKCDQCCEEL